MTASDERYQHELLRLFVEIAQSSAFLLSETQSVISCIERLSRAGDFALKMFESGDFSPSRLARHSKSTRVFAVRLLDRFMAILGLLNVHADAALGIRPFSGLVQDGERLLDEIHPARERVQYELAHMPTLGQYRLLGGVVADALDLIDDLRVAVHAPASLLLGIRADWQPVVSSLNLQITSHDSLPCGRVLDEGQVATRVHWTIAEVRKARRTSRLLAVSLWDGQVGYPEVQFLSADGPPDFLPQLLKSLRPSFTPWLVALWLGTNIPDLGRPIDLLVDQASWDRLRTFLDDEELLVSSAVVSSGGIRASAASADLDDLYRQNQGRWIAAIPSPLVYGGTRSGAKPVSPGRRSKTLLKGELYRVTSGRFGPFFFSQCARAGDGGRFDLLVSTGCGTCYTATSARGAIAEVLGRVPVINLQAVTSRTLWQLLPLRDVGPLLDLTDPNVVRRLDLALSTFASRSRRATQVLANAVFGANFRGVIHLLREAPDSSGVALFGRGGRSTPECSNHSSWHVARSPLAESQDFWDWVTSRERSRGVYVLMSQLPYAV